MGGRMRRAEAPRDVRGRNYPQMLGWLLGLPHDTILLGCFPLVCLITGNVAEIINR